jgi:AraC-like DNA-binding protein/ligand-binding sensor protein
MSASAVYDALVRSALAHELESAFMEATGLPVVLMPSGEPLLLLTFRGRENPFCSLMAQSAVSCIACQKAHRELQQRIADNLVPQVTHCFAGLSEFAVPIIVGGQHVATLLGGQIFQRKPTQAQFARLREQLRIWGMQHEWRRIEIAFFKTHVISQNQFQASLRLLTIFAKFLADDANRDLLAARIQDQHWITRAKNFVLNHAAEPLHLRDVAEHVHLSTSYFSRFFKKATGLGFSEFLARARVEIAKNSLADPGLSINEVANQAGFGSLSQFNRTFQRYVGCSPREYRASLLQDHSL